MSNQPPGLWAQIFARDPRVLVRFPELPIDAALAELAQLTDAPAAPSDRTPPAMTAAENDQLPQAISSLATHLWRAKGKLVDPATGEPREESRRIYRHVEAAIDTFTNLGVTMNDWLNQPYDPGLPVKVLTFQPTPELTRDTVVEAVRPTVMWNDRLLQLAEVIVGIPPDKVS